MHELSVAHAILSTAAEAAGPATVREVNVRVGALSGVVADALSFAWEVAVDGTALADAVLVVEQVPLRLYCTTCEDVVTVTGHTTFRCPVCCTLSGDVRSGRELEIVSLVVDDPVPAVGG